MIMEQGLTRQSVFAELAKSPHGKLEEYLPLGRQAAREDPEFFAHLVAWNARKGQIRDAKVALPLISLESMISREHGDPVLMDNAKAHLALLSPRDLLRGVRFAKTQSMAGRRQAVPKLVKAYLHSMEANPGKWTRTIVQHRRTMHELYAFCHVKPAEFNKSVLFEGGRPKGSVFDTIANLSIMDGLEAAGAVLTKKIPFLIAAPALGKKLQDKNILAAMIDRMTPAELTSHMKMLEKLGIRKDPTLRGALEKALGRVATGTSNVMKLSQAADALDDDEFKEKVRAVQEKKLDKTSLEGDWLVLADASSSMQVSMEVAKSLSALLARVAKGRVHLVFFNTSPTYFDVTGKTLEDVQKITARMVANGSTSIGVGCRYIVERKFAVDGIAIVSDGGENHPPAFATAYKELTKMLDRQVPVYFYHVPGDRNVLTSNCSGEGLELHEFPITSAADYYSLPNMVETMRTNRYSLVDEIMEQPLLSLADVLKLETRDLAHA